jgi:hypothetical protein
MVLALVRLWEGAENGRQRTAPSQVLINKQSAEASHLERLWERREKASKNEESARRASFVFTKKGPVPRLVRFLEKRSLHLGE